MADNIAESMEDLALLVLRATFGRFLAGHGAQKLFGWFSGPGQKGTAGWLESMGLTPGQWWAAAAAASEFGGGALTLLGFLSPLGPVASLGSMGMATAKVHWGKPIWVTTGGAELPITNMALATALMLAGPGRFSLDEVLGTALPRWAALPGVALAVAGVTLGLKTSATQQQAAQQQSAA
ncbi:MAG TPA: DoxX family protein [Ktedonobacterales bacterium]|nr:DoxX family protein [Ktedonobacterales bacterium]